MADTRLVRSISSSRPTIEGAGVHLRRAIGGGDPHQYDPFLLLDDFRATRPEQYVKGFPWHPHRGIETITYVLTGTVEHSDSLGNSGVIGSGDVQWMTAGSGILHQEMPTGDEQGAMGGFQLWANLPAADKMMAPRYRGLTSAGIPEAAAPGGVRINVICGEANGVRGPVQDVVTDPQYLDVLMPPAARFVHATPRGHTVFAYVIAGEGSFGGGQAAQDGQLVSFADGDQVEAAAGAAGARFLLISGRPIGEPIAWYGPIVMNTQAELRQAYDELQAGTFIKAGGRP